MSFENSPEVKWGSFIPALTFALADSVGPNIEIGVGHFSTPMMHEFSRATGRGLWSFEADDGWFDHFSKIYTSSFHTFVKGYDVFFYTGRKWGTVFIDNSPGGAARLDPFLKFFPISDYVVVHDFHRENEEAILPVLEALQKDRTAWWKVFNDYDPPTLLASSKFDIL